MGDLMHCLQLDRRELPEAALTAPAVVRPFDPDHDRQSQLLSRAPSLAVEDVLLEQREERLHGGVVGAGAAPAHRTRPGWWSAAGGRTWPIGTDCPDPSAPRCPPESGARRHLRRVATASEAFILQ